MPKTYCAAIDFAPLMDCITAGELRLELSRYVWRKLLNLEASAVIAPDQLVRIEDRTIHRNGYRPRTLTTQAYIGGLSTAYLAAGQRAKLTRSMRWWVLWDRRID